MKSENRNQKSEKMTNAEEENSKEDLSVGTSRRNKKPYDLSERTALFGETIIHFAKRIPVGLVTSPLISQLVRCGTSVGANYEEANDAESQRDFQHKIGICRKESRETKFFLRMMVAAVPAMRDDAAHLYQEAKELNLIFGSMRQRKAKAPERP